MSETMTTRERWMAALRCEPVDRLPFWPKLDGSYPPAQRAPFSTMSLEDLHAWVGSDQHRWCPALLREQRSRTVLEEKRQGDLLHRRLGTRHGDLTATDRWDEASQSWHPVEFPVKRAADLPLLAEFCADVAVELDAELMAGAQAWVDQIGESAVTALGIGKTPLMHFVELLAGVETAHLLLADAPQAVEALFAVLRDQLLHRARLLAELCPADLLYLIENTSTTVISPAQYRRYCLPVVRQCAELALEAGRPLVLHMCGHLRHLLPDLATLPVAAFEAFTSPPVGNTRLAEGRRACPDTCLIGGTNAALWLRPPADITAELERDLGELPHHRGIAVTSAGVMPPGCPPETIRAVGQWVRAYPCRC